MERCYVWLSLKHVERLLKRAQLKSVYVLHFFCLFIEISFSIACVRFFWPLFLSRCCTFLCNMHIYSCLATKQRNFCLTGKTKCRPYWRWETKIAVEKATDLLDLRGNVLNVVFFKLLYSFFIFCRWY